MLRSLPSHKATRKTEKAYTQSLRDGATQRFRLVFACAKLDAMRLLTGPAGSGKTSFVVERFTEALRANHHAVRLLVPTATLAQHQQNRVAREGFVFRRNLIQTLSAFVENWAGDRPEAPETVRYLIVEEAVARLKRPEFRQVAQFPGFCAAVARTIHEFSSAGCDSSRLAAHLPNAPLAAAFLAVYRETDRLLESRGFALRAQRLERAAERIRNEGLGGIETIWLDGFHALPDPELAVIEALGRHAEVTLTLSDSEAGEGLRAKLWAMGFEEERAPGERAPAELKLVRAANLEREVDDIARRILEQAAAGRAFREMGVIVRAAETYVPILRGTFERFGIPARVYFDEELERHPAVRFLTGAVDALLGGWDHAATLAVLRLAPRFADSPTLDRFDFELREQLPGSGLGGLKALLAETESRLSHVVDSLAALEEWRSFEMNPRDWTARFRTLRNLFRAAAPPENGDHGAAVLGRTQAAALQAFDDVVAEAAQALDAKRPLGLAEFWRAVKAALRLKPLRVEDRRRNVVHILSAPEARQWVLPVVFVCGMVEKQFPQFHQADPFFPEAARLSLNAAGIRVRTAAEFEREERALFHSAITRATGQVTLSYPEFDSRGDRCLRSLYVEDLNAVEEQACPVRPEPRFVPAAPRTPAIQGPALLAFLAQKTAHVSPSGLESLQQCPFQYFARTILRLKERPARPEERLDFLTQGTIVHATLAEWYSERQEIGSLFERIFQQACEEGRIPQGYHTERLRQSMRADLERFARDSTWPRESFQSRVEAEFDIPISDSLWIRGRIDRVDTLPEGRSYVIDYKYSRAQSLKERLQIGDIFQAPLYLIAAEKAFGMRPAGVFYVGLKGAVEYKGWSEPGFIGSDPLPENWQASAADRAIGLVTNMRQGHIAPAPRHPEKCRFCDARDVCRIEVEIPAVVVEGA